jgi:two-component sensor histidine kinase
VNTESISKKTKINPQAILDLKDVINELALNAVKHGQAEVLRVEVKSRGNNSLVVRAENNGEALGRIKPGLGSAIFDLLTGESWSLKNYGGEVVFNCRIFNE